MKISNYIISFIYLFLIAQSSANDSLARVGAGGLELLKSDHIKMVSEVLEISTAKIKVTYHFQNTTDKDITTTVAFPMPEFSPAGQISGSNGNEKPLDSFKIFSNGVRLPIKISKKFFAGKVLMEGREKIYQSKIDVTGKLRKIGLSDSQIFDPKFTCTSPYTRYPNAPLCKKLSDAQYEAINELILHEEALIQETAYWEQTFPANQDIEIVHEYKPFVGYRYDSGAAEEMVLSGCFDERAVKKLSQQNKRIHEIYDLEYILGTGRNWKGPIENFKLIIAKSSPFEFVSLCFPGKPKKTNPTTIEFVQDNYIPQDRLILYFYSLVE